MDALGAHVVLPRLGRVRMPTTALLEKFKAGELRILRATVSREGARWQVSFTCQLAREPQIPVSGRRGGHGRRGGPLGRALERTSAEPATAQEALRKLEEERFYASSTMGPCYGMGKDVLPLWERTFRGDALGLVLDRDENAAHHLAVRVAAVSSVARRFGLP